MQKQDVYRNLQEMKGWVFEDEHAYKPDSETLSNE
jgi:hypothetical protein